MIECEVVRVLSDVVVNCFSIEMTSFKSWIKATKPEKIIDRSVSLRGGAMTRIGMGSRLKNAANIVSSSSGKRNSL